MKLVFHIPCFCIHGDKVLACDNHDFRRELLEGLEGAGHLYSVHVKSFILGNLFPCEHLVLHVDDESFYKYINIFHELVCKYHSVLNQDAYFYEQGDTLVRLMISDDKH